MICIPSVSFPCDLLMKWTWLINVERLSAKAVIKSEGSRLVTRNDKQYTNNQQTIDDLTDTKRTSIDTFISLEGLNKNMEIRRERKKTVS